MSNKTWQMEIGLQIIESRQFVEFDESMQRELDRLSNARKRSIAREVGEALGRGGNLYSWFKSARMISSALYYKWLRTDPVFVDVVENVTKLYGKWITTSANMELPLKQIQWDDKMLNMAHKMTDKASAMLDFPLSRKATIKDEDGNQTIVNPANWNMASVSTMVSTADKMARLILGMRESNIDDTIQGELIAMLITGKITMEQVTEEFPEVAEVFFAQAGDMVKR